MKTLRNTKACVLQVAADVRKAGSELRLSWLMAYVQQKMWISCCKLIALYVTEVNCNDANIAHWYSWTLTLREPAKNTPWLTLHCWKAHFETNCLVNGRRESTTNGSDKSWQLLRFFPLNLTYKNVCLYLDNNAISVLVSAVMALFSFPKNLPWRGVFSVIFLPIFQAYVTLLCSVHYCSSNNLEWPQECGRRYVGVSMHLFTTTSTC